MIDNGPQTATRHVVNSNGITTTVTYWENGDVETDTQAEADFGTLQRLYYHLVDIQPRHYTPPTPAYNPGRRVTNRRELEFMRDENILPYTPPKFEWKRGYLKGESKEGEISIDELNKL